MAARSIPFAKAHGLGNDFLLVREADLARAAASGIARLICDRHSGIGADGLVVLGDSQAADASFRIFNSDGSEAGLSGNALRCAAAWLAASRNLSSGRLMFDTRVGCRSPELLSRRASYWIFRAEIGRPSFAAADVPFRPPKPVPEPICGFPMPVGDETVLASIFSMGNPQCTVFVEDWHGLDWKGLGAELERHPYFPDRANIGLVRLLSSEKIEARFWERGAGHTLASGTGSCAAAVAAHLAGKTGRRVTVAVERGEMEVNWRDDGMVELFGPAQITAEGTFYCNEEL